MEWEIELGCGCDVDKDEGEGKLSLLIRCDNCSRHRIQDTEYRILDTENMLGKKGVGKSLSVHNNESYNNKSNITKRLRGSLRTQECLQYYMS